MIAVEAYSEIATLLPSRLPLTSLGDKWYQAFPLHFWILQAIKKWRLGSPGDEGHVQTPPVQLNHRWHMSNEQQPFHPLQCTDQCVKHTLCFKWLPPHPPSSSPLSTYIYVDIDLTCDKYSQVFSLYFAMHIAIKNWTKQGWRLNTRWHMYYYVTCIPSM